MRHLFLTFCLLFSGPLVLASNTVEYRLDVAEEKIAPAGKKVKALTLNGGIPGPVLRFRVGDEAVIHVHNHLPKEETSIHWHGLLLPNSEDGVPYLTTPPILAGQSRTFRFPLTHAGTYWYHSHTGLQEQRGVYGSIVVEPREGPSVAVDRDIVLQLSDWTNERPKEVMRTLMRGSEWYAFQKGNKPSVLGAIKAGSLKDYVGNAWQKMPPMDVSDVYYDAFWINGKSSSEIDAKPGERIRFRVINAGASSYFYLHSAEGPLTVIAADGPDVEPVMVDRLLIGMAETYDVLFTVPRRGSWEIRATAQDNSGSASVFVGKGRKHRAGNLPRPNIYSMDEMMMAALNDPLSNHAMEEDMSMEQSMPMNHGETSGENEGMAESNARPLPPYHKLRARESTAIPAKYPRRKIELRLTGDMQRYLWSFNGKTLAEDSTIRVRRGEVLQMELVNDTMMHHPLHLHGHFFRLLNGQGDFAPLKHTVDVPPMATRTIEFLANEEQDWFFHCHLLYHMDAGMARVISYAEQGGDHVPNLDPKLINPSFFFLNGSIQNHMTMGRAMWMKGREDFVFAWDYGFHEHDEYEMDLFWSHYFNPDWSTQLGYRFTNDHAAEDRAFAGFTYRLPLLVRSSAQVDSEGDFRFGLEREVPLTDRISLYGDIEYDTNTEWEWAAGAEFLLSKQFSLIGGFHSDHGWGGGVAFRF